MYGLRAICLLLLTGVLAGLSWVLGLLADEISLPAFVTFAGVTVAIMVGLRFAWDRYEHRV
jgi:hypothetical protein